MDVAAESTEMSDDWDTIVTRLEREACEEAQVVVATGTVLDITNGEEAPVASESLVAVGRKRWLIAAAAAIVVGLVLAAQPWNNQEIQTVTETTELSEEVNLVLPGEVVLSEDPLIVIAAIGPEVRFDTSGLGQEVVFEPITDLDDQINQLLEHRWGPSPANAPLTKGTLIGRSGGLPFIGTIVDGPDTQPDDSVPPVGSDLRFRSLNWPGGRSGLEYLITLPSAELLANEAGAIETDPLLSGQMVVWGYLPSQTAVVSAEGPSYRAWMRPRGGAVAFSAGFDDGEPVTLVAFDADGGELGRIGGLVDRSDIVTTTSVDTDDKVGVLLGSDGEGNQTRIEADGQTKVLLVGADWCRACNDGLGDVVEVLVGVDADVYLVPSPLTDGSWPMDDPLPFQRFVPNPGSTFWHIVVALPQVIVLDGENRLVAVIEGFEGLSLTTLGLEDS